MKITKPAATAILQVMQEEKLDAQEFAVSFEVVNGGIGFSFRNDTFGREYNFYGLRIVLDDRIDAENLIIDWSEIDGRRGLIFKGEENGSNTKRKSSKGS